MEAAVQEQKTSAADLLTRTEADEDGRIIQATSGEIVEALQAELANLLDERDKGELSTSVALITTRLFEQEREDRAASTPVEERFFTSEDLQKIADCTRDASLGLQIWMKQEISFDEPSSEEGKVLPLAIEETVLAMSFSETLQDINTLSHTAITILNQRVTEQAEAAKKQSEQDQAEGTNLAGAAFSSRGTRVKVPA